MASTIKVSDTIAWAQQFLYSQPLALGAANEPAITIANIILQAILGPPFRWNWNRATPAAFALTAGTQDYSKNYSDFGFLEQAWITDAGGTTKEIEQIVESLSVETVSAPPRGAVAAQLDDNAGNITFRFSPNPDLSTYTAQPIYQKKPTLIAATSTTWTPIPDHLSYIYQYGFLGMALAFKRDPRAGIYDSRFVAHLLGCQGGLSEMQKNVFLGKWLSTSLELQAASMRSQQGVQGRGQ
ncbi:MAG: hypothetical protein WB770_03970 [Acidimicrobiales bacterium]